MTKMNYSRGGAGPSVRYPTAGQWKDDRLKDAQFIEKFNRKAQKRKELTPPRCESYYDALRDVLKRLGLPCDF